MSPLSFASINPNNLELTPCRVNYKGIDLGATLGNVVIKIEDSLADLKSDQLGTTIIDKKVSGIKVTIETELAEVKLKDNWKVVFPSHKLVTSGSNKLFLFDSTVGVSLRDLAGQLILHPLSKPDSDLSSDILVYLATAEGKADLSFAHSDQQKLKVVWDMFPDFTTLPPRFFIYGDPSVGLQNAVAGAATAGTGNTGNGTVGSIAVFNGTTKTETISLLALSATKFQVSGSLSGQLGVATVGATFNSLEIAFLITAGGTPFAVNDNFAIATTAANYS